MSTVQIDYENYEDFPTGLRIIAVDDDPVGLKILESMLRRCEFHVTTASLSILAVKLLREDKDQFDLVISQVDMPDIDGFKRLQITGLGMDRPVIMVSTNCDPKIVMKANTDDACDYLLKPIRIEELKNIWQHMLTRKTFGKFVKDSPFTHMGSLNGLGDFQALTGKLTDASPSEPAQIGKFNGSDDPSAQKEPRSVWTNENRLKFLGAAMHSGFENAAPERVLELMNVEGLTLEEVASHLKLEKYSLKLLRFPPSQAAKIQAAARKDKEHQAFLRQIRRDAALSSPHAPVQIGKFNGSDDPSAQKKPRSVWTNENQWRFPSAAAIPWGFEKSEPERILERMKGKGLTPEEVTRHLESEKYSFQLLHCRPSRRANIKAAARKDKEYQALIRQKRRDVVLSSPHTPEAVPETVLELMNVEEPTREEVARPLQVQRYNLRNRKNGEGCDSGKMQA